MQFIAFPGQRDKTLIFLTTYFSFDDVSLKSEVKLAVISFSCEAKGTRSHLDLSNSPFTLEKLADLAKICMLKNPRLFSIKIVFSIFVC